MTRYFILAASAIAACSSPAYADSSFGRLVDSKSLASFAQETCGTAAKKSNTNLVSKAKLGKWDELGRTAATPPGSRAWMVSLKGQPVIVDVSQAAVGRTCSVSAVTDPSSVVGAILRLRGAKPQTRKLKNNTIVTWPATKAFPRTDVAYGGGQAMARITYAFTN